MRVVLNVKKAAANVDIDNAVWLKNSAGGHLECIIIQDAPSSAYGSLKCRFTGYSPPSNSSDFAISVKD